MSLLILCLLYLFGFVVKKYTRLAYLIDPLWDSVLHLTDFLVSLCEPQGVLVQFLSELVFSHFYLSESKGQSNYHIFQRISFEDIRPWGYIIDLSEEPFNMTNIYFIFDL